MPVVFRSVLALSAAGAYGSSCRRVLLVQLRFSRASGPTPRSTSCDPPVNGASARMETVPQLGDVTNLRLTSPLLRSKEPSLCFFSVDTVGGRPTSQSSSCNSASTLTSSNTPIWRCEEDE